MPRLRFYHNATMVMHTIATMVQCYMLRFYHNATMVPHTIALPVTQHPQPSETGFTAVGHTCLLYGIQGLSPQHRDWPGSLVSGTVGQTANSPQPSIVSHHALISHHHTPTAHKLPTSSHAQITNNMQHHRQQGASLMACPAFK